MHEVQICDACARTVAGETDADDGYSEGTDANIGYNKGTLLASADE